MGVYFDQSTRGVGIGSARRRRRDRRRKGLAVAEAGGRRDEGLVEQRLSAGAVIVVSVRSVGAHDARRQTFERACRICRSRRGCCSCRRRQRFSEQSVLKLRRVREANARSEVGPLGGSEGVGNAWIAGKDHARGRARINTATADRERRSAAGCISRAKAAARPSAGRNSASGSSADRQLSCANAPMYLLRM